MPQHDRLDPTTPPISTAIAAHEAGHYICAVVGDIEVTSITTSHGHPTATYPHTGPIVGGVHIKLKPVLNDQAVFNQVVMYLAGQVAEELFFSTPPTKAGDLHDLDLAHTLLTDRLALPHPLEFASPTGQQHTTTCVDETLTHARAAAHTILGQPDLLAAVTAEIICPDNRTSNTVENCALTELQQFVASSTPYATAKELVG